MPVWLLLIVISLAVYRLTRLIVKDTFPPVRWTRDRLVGGWRPLTSAEWAYVRSRDKDNALDLLKGERPAFQTEKIDGEVNRWVEKWPWVPEWLSDLLSCAWCASGWVSLAVVVAVAFTVGVPAPVLVWPAVWGAGSLIAAQKWS
jgi:hypothetical protein